MAHGARAKNRHRIAEPNVGEIDRVQRRDEAAAATDERFRIQLLREMNELHTRTRVQRLRPTTE